MPALAFALLAPLLLFPPGCTSKIDDKPKAQVEDASVQAGGEISPAPEGALPLTRQGSKVGFIGAKLRGDHEGSFSEIEGWAKVEAGELRGMQLHVHMDSMQTDDERLTKHLKNADFFDVPSHPLAHFTLESCTAKAANGGTHELVGVLEMKGVAKKITFPARLEIQPSSVHGEAAFSIDRKRWGIDYPGKKDNLIKDEVAILLELSFG
jgi:polyisoprenoid-binding protein YceI